MELTKMHGRQQLADLVLRQGVSVSEACRRLGVSRVTGHLWVSRARESGVSGLAEKSRRPHKVCAGAPEEAVEALLALKSERPSWGAKKLRAKLWPEGAPMSLRTADRELKRHGLTGHGPKRLEAPCRFERERPNELWQMDFKGVGQRSYEALSVLDDCTRFCVAFRPLPGLDWRTTFDALWDVFGEFGMPECFLTDNGAPFNSVRSLGPTPLQARLWLLGVRTVHGRPRHPQTQGKVERFHLTAEQELGPTLRLANVSDVEKAMAEFREDYNWERPHEAVGLRAPGTAYCCSTRKRPAKMPAHEIPEGSIARKVDASGKAVYKMQRYRAGVGLTGQHVEIRDEEHGQAMFFAGVRIASLEVLKV